MKIMKNLIMVLLLFLAIINLNAQGNPPKLGDTNTSLNGIFDNVFDQYGNKYQLSDLIVGKDSRDTGGKVYRTAAISCTSGYFNLNFEEGSGMENTSDPIQNQRRDVICQVFQDISTFINSPLTTNGLGNKVNIWVRNINNVIVSPNSPNGVLGLATSFYNIPSNSSTGFGGIADNEVWKTIHAGVDSYTNAGLPITSTGVSSGISGFYYHGMMAFNFNTTNTPPINWNTNLSITAPAGQYDLYSIVLHEVTHALGFASLINENGASKFGAGFNYFSRYDRFLKDNSNSQFLLTKGSACGSMYNYAFNSLLSPAILRPGCLISGNINNNASLNSTICANAIKYSGAVSTVPVYTPVCFEPPSSLSHFEDQLYPTCSSPYGNDTYFSMSNANGTGVNKRFLKPEERNVLCDLGYNVNTTYGSTAQLSFKNYGGNVCTGISVAGINDGIYSDGSLTLVGASPLIINNSAYSFLENDINATSFECLEDVYSVSTFSATSGNSQTSVTITSTTKGLHLLRYVPVNASGQKGNITYIFVYFPIDNNCATPTPCDLVVNGDFEQTSATEPIQDQGQIALACGWKAVSENFPSVDYFGSDAFPAGMGIPCNSIGYQTVNNSLGTRYAGIGFRRVGMSVTFEKIKTKLFTPLSPNTSYQLSFDVSIAEGMSANAIKLQAFLSANDIITANDNTNLPTVASNSNMLFTNPTYSTTTSGWENIKFIIPASSIVGNEQYLYIGGLFDFQLLARTPANGQVGGCNYNTSLNNIILNPGYGYYYLDNVKLQSLNGASFNMPSSVCSTQTISDMRDFLTLTPTNGVFSGPGVSGTSFNASTAGGLGVKTITYTYTNSQQCTVTIASNITVSACNSTSCPGSLVFNTTEPSTSRTYQANGSIITNTNYIVNSGSTITLKAGDSITFSINSEIKAGSDFTAQIGPCTQTSARYTDEEENPMVSNDDLKLYPNPTNGILSIEMPNSSIDKISIFSLDGKLILDSRIEPTNSYQVDVSSCNNGLYILKIETTDGKKINKKIIKN